MHRVGTMHERKWRMAELSDAFIALPGSFGTPIEQPAAFKAIYRVLLDKTAGPKAGNLLAFLDPNFVLPRFRELPFERLAYWRETATPMPELEQWMEKEREKIATHTTQLLVEGGATANEFTFVLHDGKRLLKRVLAEGPLLA